MASKKELRCDVNDLGKIPYQTALELSDFMIKNKSKTVTITLDAGKKRSGLQNRYYHGVVVPFVMNLFHNVGHQEMNNEDVHEFLKQEFNKSNIEINGNYISYPKSTTDLNTDGFMDFIEKINQFTSSMFSVSLPPPNSMVDAFSYIT